MSDVAIAQQMVFSVAPYERHEPLRSGDDRLLNRALAVSLVLHLAILCGGIFTYWFTLPAPVVGPRAIDVELVELSAFDTALPPPHLPPQEPKARAVIPPPVEPSVQSVRAKPVEKRVEVKDTVKVKRDVERHDNEQGGATQSPTVNAASIGGGNDATQKARISYHHMVATLLAKAKRYPERAVRARVTGSGAVRLTISSVGVVTNVEVATSTQSTLLDEELVRMVERAAPFPSIPSDMGQSEVTLLVPVSFRLES